jgi:hypothetical protein
MEDAGERARSCDEEIKILIVDSGHSNTPPTVHAVAWDESPFKDADVPALPTSFHVVMNEQEDPDEMAAQELDLSNDECTITTICNKLNMNADTAYADVYDWIYEKKYQGGIRVLHPEGVCAMPSKVGMMLFVSTHESEYTFH